MDFLQPDVARAGGISEIRKIAVLAAKHNIALSFHTWGDGVALAASLHLSAALKQCGVMEFDCTYNPLRAELLQEPLEVKNGFMVPPDKPGLGVKLNRDALERFVFSGVEELTIRPSALGSP